MPLSRAATAAVLVLALLGESCGAGSDDGESSASSTDPLFTTEFVLFESGEAVTLSDYGGTPLVVNLWASWCPNCLTEMPDIETVSRELSDEVMFIGIGVDDERAAAERLLADTGVTYLIGTDDAGLFPGLLGGLGLPITGFISAGGVLVESWTGQLTADALREMIDEHLLSAEAPSADPNPGVAAAAATADETFDESYLNTRVGSNFPALDDPVLVAGSTATWLDPDDIVMGIVSDSGEAQAYPVDQMTYHHVANTSLAGEPFVVTY